MITRDFACSPLPPPPPPPRPPSVKKDAALNQKEIQSIEETHKKQIESIEENYQ